MGKLGKRRLLLVVSLLVLLAGLAAWQLVPKPRKTNGTMLLQFAQGDTLGGYSIYTHDGQELDIADVANEPTLVIFGMDGCRDCIADFPSYKALYALYNSQELAVVFVWDDKIPQKELDKLGIPPSASYTAKGNYKFTEWVPYYYFVDTEDTITYTTVQLEQAIEKLPQRSIDSEAFQRLAGGKPVLVGIESCGSCRSAHEELTAQGIDFVYYLEGVEQLTDKHPSNANVDPYRILSKAFGLDVYPVYITLDQQGKLVLDATI